MHAEMFAEFPPLSRVLPALTFDTTHVLSDASEGTE